MLFSPKEKGQGLVEYALILVFVFIVVFAIMWVVFKWVIVPMLKDAFK